jgi:hypothetical protein
MTEDQTTEINEDNEITAEDLMGADELTVLKSRAKLPPNRMKLTIQAVQMSLSLMLSPERILRRRR